MKQWYTQDGRVLQVNEMKLDHLINSWHMMAFMVARMRKAGVNALGGANNRNVNTATLDAFKLVVPGDVFPLYEQIKDAARSKFSKEFAVSLSDVKAKVFEAWNSQNSSYTMSSRYEKAVRFMLKATGEASIRKVQSEKLHMMLKLAEVETDAQFQRIAWNMRIDQAKLWKQITDEGYTAHVKRIPPNRLRSALKFVASRAVSPVSMDNDMPFDIKEGWDIGVSDHPGDASRYRSNRWLDHGHRLIDVINRQNDLYCDIPFYAGR